MNIMVFFGTEHSWAQKHNKYNGFLGHGAFVNSKTEKNIFLSLNPFYEIDKEKILENVEFTHPYYDKQALENQKKLKIIQNKKNLLFCGSYFGYGFHEDGIKSSLEMIKHLDDK